MKVQDFAYRVAARTMEILETQQHYKVPEETRKKVLQQIRAEINILIQQAG